jgi:hypothetical protein
LSLIVEVPSSFGDAVGQRQRHAGIVGPFTRIEAVWPACTIVGDRREGARWLELDSRPQGISDGHSQQATALFVLESIHLTLLYFRDRESLQPQLQLAPITARQTRL